MAGRPFFRIWTSFGQRAIGGPISARTRRLDRVWSGGGQSVCHDHCGARARAGRSADRGARRFGAARAQRRHRARRLCGAVDALRGDREEQSGRPLRHGRAVGAVAGDGVRPRQASAAGARHRRPVVRGVPGRRLGVLPARGLDRGAGVVDRAGGCRSDFSTARSAWSASRCSRWCRSSISTR